MAGTDFSTPIEKSRGTVFGQFERHIHPRFFLARFEKMGFLATNTKQQKKHKQKKRKNKKEAAPKCEIKLRASLPEAHSRV